MGLFSKQQVLYKKKTKFNDITVSRSGNMITLYSPEPVRQTVINVKQGFQPILEYSKHLPLCLAFCPCPVSILVLGLGGGVLPGLLSIACKQAVVDVVELDPEMPKIAGRFFGFTPSDRLRVFIDDAFAFINETDNRYDIIIVDTYLGNELPITVDHSLFWRECAGCLSEKGVLAVNLMTKDKKLLQKRLDSIGRFFPGEFRWLLPGQSAKNLVVFAPVQEISKDMLIENWKSIKSSLPFKLNGRKLIHRLTKAFLLPK
jgi:spermidine synthase